MRTQYLLNPEWQGYGLDPSVHDGALAMARTLFPNAAFTSVEVPREESLAVRDGVLGLSSIATRFQRTLRSLRASAPDAIVTVGGTCGVEAAPVAYLNERYSGDLAVVWFDAHGDLNSPATSPSGHFHGMVLRSLLGDGPPEMVAEMRRPLEARQIFLVGTRDLDPDESRFIRESGISMTLPEDLADPDIVSLAVRARGFRHVYLHLDLDCFRPDEIPDTLMRTPGGPPLEAIRNALAALERDFVIAGSSIVEYVERGGQSLARLKEIVGDQKSGIRN